MTEEEIINCSKRKWSKIVHEKTEEKGLKMLLEENKTKEKTKHIKLEKLKISNYLQRNTNTKLSKTIFQIRAGTFDIKSWRKWDYDDNLCVACQLYEENMEHFMTCESYGRKNKTNWRKIYENDSAIEEKIAIAKEAIERKTVRNNLQEGGQTSTLGS